MCIVCNCDDPNHQHGSDFLTAFQQVQRYMKASAEAMLKCSKVAPEAEMRKGYDHTHKQIVRFMREWNKLEHSREHPTPADGGEKHVHD